MNHKTIIKTTLVGLAVLFINIAIELDTHHASGQNLLPPAPPNFVGVKEPTVIKLLGPSATNSAVHVSSHSIRVYSFRKECLECTNIVTSTNYHITKRDSLRSLKEYTIMFHCNECGEDFSDTIELPMKKTKIEMVTVQTVKQ